jgi:anti-anti-sigma factor
VNRRTVAVGDRSEEELMQALATFEVSDIDDGVVVTIDGEVDASNADELRGVVRPHLTARSFVVGCEHLDFVDSSGLEVLMLIASARDEIEPLELRGQSPNVDRLLEVTGTTVLFAGTNAA